MPVISFKTNYQQRSWCFKLSSVTIILLCLLVFSVFVELWSYSYFYGLSSSDVILSESEKTVTTDGENDDQFDRNYTVTLPLSQTQSKSQSQYLSDSLSLSHSHSLSDSESQSHSADHSTEYADANPKFASEGSLSPPAAMIPNTTVTTTTAIATSITSDDPRILISLFSEWKMLFRNLIVAGNGNGNGTAFASNNASIKLLLLRTKQELQKLCHIRQQKENDQKRRKYNYHQLIALRRYIQILMSQSMQLDLQEQQDQLHPILDLFYCLRDCHERERTESKSNLTILHIHHSKAAGSGFRATLTKLVKQERKRNAATAAFSSTARSEGETDPKETRRGYVHDFSWLPLNSEMNVDCEKMRRYQHRSGLSLLTRENVMFTESAGHPCDDIIYYMVNKFVECSTVV